MSIRDWISRAMEFLQNAEQCLDEERFAISCFSAHQAAELMLKALLLQRTGTYPFTHSLTELLDSLESIGIPSEERVYQAAEALEPHYTRSRYPSVHWRKYDRKIAERCISHARKIIKFVRSFIEA